MYAPDYDNLCIIVKVMQIENNWHSYIDGTLACFLVLRKIRMMTQNNNGQCVIYDTNRGKLFLYDDDSAIIFH